MCRGNRLSQAEFSLTGQALPCYPSRVTEFRRERARLKRRECSRSSLNSDVPAAVSLPALVFVEVIDVAGVMIGIDPHKRSHPAVALDGREKRLGQVRVRATAKQVDGLLEWAGGWRRRTCAIEGARGLGHLLAQQLLARGERMLDVPPKLAARVRLLNTGQINKTDDNDARSVAIAALRGHDVTELSVEDQTVVMRVWARRYHDLGRLRTQAVCRLHTVLGELVPGGVRRDLQASQALAALDRIDAETPIVQAKVELARELVADLQRLDAQRREAKRRAALAVAASGTSIIEIYGVGPIVAASVLGYVRDIRRFANRDRFASYNGTAPIEVSSGDHKVHRLSRRGNRQPGRAIGERHCIQRGRLTPRHTGSSDKPLPGQGQL